MDRRRWWSVAGYLWVLFVALASSVHAASSAWLPGEAALGDLFVAANPLLVAGENLGDRVLVAGMLGVAALIGLVTRRRRLAVWSLVGLVTATVSQLVLKPLVGRRIGDEFAFPSGHATGSAVVGVAWWVAAGCVPHRGCRVALRVLAVLWVIFGAMSPAAGGWHAPLDVVGAMLLVAAVSATFAALVPGNGNSPRSQ